MEATAGCKCGAQLDLSVLWLVLGVTPNPGWALFLHERSQQQPSASSFPFACGLGGVQPNVGTFFPVIKFCMLIIRHLEKHGPVDKKENHGTPNFNIFSSASSICVCVYMCFCIFTLVGLRIVLFPLSACSKPSDFHFWCLCSLFHHVIEPEVTVSLRGI